MFQYALSGGVLWTALLGFPGLAVFLNSCGTPPSLTLRPDLSPDTLALQVAAWYRQRDSHRGYARGPETLTIGERQALLVISESASLSRSIKTLSVLRGRALKRLGLRSARELLANSWAGDPDPVARYQRLLNTQGEEMYST